MTDIYMGADASVNENFALQIKDQTENIINELLENIKLKKGDIFVVGCSSSEILGSKIGKGSSYAAAEIVFNAIYPRLKENGIYLAAQCCEHLNRAIVIERECAERYGYDEVSVIPQPKAGGSFATLAYKSFENPVLVEHIRSSAGIDIGGTLIGMHLKDVAVPIRVSNTKIGEANIICAYTRPKYIGGSRAIY